MTAPSFSIKNLSLDRKGIGVLYDVTMDVPPNKTVCLLGPSGSGKSSLLRCLNRLTEPPAKSVFIDDRDVTSLEILALRRRVGFVFQQVAMFPGTVAENIAYGPGLQHKPLPEEEIERLLALADLPNGFGERDSGQLSGGQAQRVALARSLATRPEALLLDEPTSSLDPSATRSVEETVIKLRASLGLTVLWVTHNADQARRIADWVYLLVDGAIVDQGDPAHVLDPDSSHLTAAFAAGKIQGST